MRPLKVAAAGTGYFSQFHYDAWSRLPVELAACCSLEPESARAVADRYAIPSTFTDFEAMLDEVRPDLVDIITPPPTHAGFVAAAAARNIPCICQKPFCRDLSEAAATAAMLDERGAICVVHENFRFQPWHRELKRLIGSGVLGETYQASFRLRPGDGQGPEAYLSRQPYFQKMERFLIHETAIHLIDVFRFLLGEIEEVTADLRRLNPAISGEDAGLVIFGFADNVRALFDGNRLADHVADNRRLTMGDMLIEGSAGTVSLDGNGRIHIRLHGENAWRLHEYAWTDTAFGGDCVHRLQSHVIAHLTDGSPLENTARDYVRNLEVEDAVYRSSDKGRRLRIDGLTA